MKTKAHTLNLAPGAIILTDYISSASSGITTVARMISGGGAFTIGTFSPATARLISASLKAYGYKMWQLSEGVIYSIDFKLGNDNFKLVTTDEGRFRCVIDNGDTNSQNYAGDWKMILDILSQLAKGARK